MTSNPSIEPVTTGQIVFSTEADSFFCTDQLEAALRSYASRLSANETDIYSMYQTAATLARMAMQDGRVDGDAISAMERASMTFSHTGRPLMALIAGHEISEYDAATGVRVLTDVATHYCATSSFLNTKRRAKPPAGAPSRQFDTKLFDVEETHLIQAAQDSLSKAILLLPDITIAKRTLPFIPLLSALPLNDFLALASACTISRLNANDILIAQENVGDTLFILVRGVVSVEKDGQQLARLRSGAFIGEIALLAKCARTAQVVCETPVTVLALTRDRVQALAATSAEIAKTLSHYAQTRMVDSLINTAPFFAPLDAERRRALVDQFEPRLCTSGEVILEEGDVGEGLFLVLSGNVVVSKRDGGETLVLAELGTGDVFGEISLIQKCAATATVIAPEQAVVLCLSRERFNACVKDYPEMLAHIYQLVVERESTNLATQEAAPIFIDDDALLV